MVPVAGALVLRVEVLTGGLPIQSGTAGGVYLAHHERDVETYMSFFQNMCARAVWYMLCCRSNNRFVFGFVSGSVALCEMQAVVARQQWSQFAILWYWTVCFVWCQIPNFTLPNFCVLAVAPHEVFHCGLCSQQPPSTALCVPH